jgi:hypothetical protein
MAPRSKSKKQGFLVLTWRRAKKDDFEQGLALCLVEMDACADLNRQIGRDITIRPLSGLMLGRNFCGTFYKTSLDGLLARPISLSQPAELSPLFLTGHTKE